MTDPNIVLNTDLEAYGNQFITKSAPISGSLDPDVQKRKQLTLLFEQFLLFDKIAIKIDRQNLPLYFLINEIGLNKTEELLENNILKLVLWTPVIVTSTGTMREDKSVDHSTIFGTPPIVSGSYSKEDSDPERNIDTLLNYFSITRERKKIFKKIALKQYILPNNDVAVKAKDIVIDAYLNNRFNNLGLGFVKDPDQLDHEERVKLLMLGYEVLETLLLAENRFKSYDKYSYFSLTSDSIKQIESAYHVSENTSKILELQNIADIQSLVLENKIPFDRVFTLRYKPTFKAYRKWINTISVNTDSQHISNEYIDELMGKSNFFQSSKGRFLRTVGMFGIGTGLSTAIDGAALSIMSAGTGLGLTLFDSFILEKLLRGWTPKMFIDKLKQEINPD